MLSLIENVLMCTCMRMCVLQSTFSVGRMFSKSRFHSPCTIIEGTEALRVGQSMGYPLLV